MTGLQAICLNLSDFTVEDGQKLFNGIMIDQPKLIWPEMYSIKVRGQNVQPAGIMSRCSEFNLKALDLDEWVFSRGFIKTIAVENLKSLRLYFDKDRMLDSESSNTTFPSLDFITWEKLSRLGRVCPLLDCIILQEADCYKKGEFSSVQHHYMLVWMSYMFVPTIYSQIHRKQHLSGCLEK